MPTFPTPEPIDATIEVAGDVRITASDRTDTVVVVRPADPSKPGDIRTVEQTTVEYTDGRLLVKTPKRWRNYTPFGGYDAVDVSIELPTSSQITTDSTIGHVSAEGQLGRCRIKTARQPAPRRDRRAARRHRVRERHRRPCDGQRRREDRIGRHPGQPDRRRCGHQELERRHGHR